MHMHIVLVISSMLIKMRISAIVCAFIVTCIFAQQVQALNINGGWSTWGAYGACSVTCGHGLLTRRRTCTNPEPEGTGSDCAGKSYTEAACAPSESCPVPSYIDPDGEKVEDNEVDKDCAHWRDVGGYNETGVYVLNLNQLRPLVKHVRCDMETDGGGWTVIQRRYDGQTYFDRNWESYKHGFGYPTKELWLGNEAVHLMTRNRNHTLRMEMETVEGNQTYVEYSVFHIKSELDGYRLFVSGYSGNVDDMMSGLGPANVNGQRFTTLDKDNDDNTNLNCSPGYGSWWMKDCTGAVLNSGQLSDMIYGETNVQLVKSEMKIRPSDFN